jgi:hypothetical protein
MTTTPEEIKYIVCPDCNGSGEQMWPEQRLWDLEEMRECITVVRLIKGTPTAEDLTAAVLRG